MTHEELVEKVAEAIFWDYSNGNQKMSEAIDATQNSYRSMAREAIRITLSEVEYLLNVCPDSKSVFEELQNLTEGNKP